ncbi:PREDICTED: serum response factor-binding protein 1 [Papilio polytes]|uniref:serum response factor-binding protein 1 n=1 Tax=Papilio polytes TaxID=76194 RepID=UPI000676993E|nr:PREDICTED: serum response factor-binding protein 1 [Papilio polytes]
MEVGAVKQAFNNEIILMKRNLNQAKIQIIHKLTRKAKTLAEKKAPENLKEKLKKKAESAVKEVLIIKKIKAKDIAKFIVTYNGELAKYLNKPEVDHNKACARLLLHKSMQNKHKSIRDTFGNTAINDLFMSRLERRKLKKEAREKQQNKKKAKEAKKLVNIEGDWDVEDIGNKGTTVKKVQDNGSDRKDTPDSDDGKESDEGSEIDEQQSDMVNAAHNSDDESSSDEPDNDLDSDEEALIDSEQSGSDINKSQIVSDSDNSDTEVKESKLKRKGLQKKEIEDNSNKSSKLPKEVNKKKKDVNKNKNFNEKILKRKFNKDIEEQPAEDIKMVDPFFITTTGESYMSVVEPRQPDEVKEVHQEGNRKYRRAVMFGHVQKPRRNEFKQDNRRFKDLSNANDRFSENNKKKFTNENKKEGETIEKLHPSWEAKKKKSGILPFEGKKIVFDD